MAGEYHCCSGHVGSFRARTLPFRNMRLECRCAGTRHLGPRFADRNSARVVHRILPFPMSLFMQHVPTGTCMKNRTLLVWTCRSIDCFEGQAFRASRPGASSTAACRYVRTHSFTRSSGDTVTFDGATFLDMQLAPHRAEASTPTEQADVYHEEHEAMSNSTSTSNIVGFLTI